MHCGRMAEEKGVLVTLPHVPFSFLSIFFKFLFFAFHFLVSCFLYNKAVETTKETDAYVHRSGVMCDFFLNIKITKQVLARILVLQ